MFKQQSAQAPRTEHLEVWMKRAALISLALLAFLAISPAFGQSMPTATLPFQWPVAKGGQITEGYGEIKDASPTRHHTALDISAPEGTPVLATAAGLVVRVQENDTIQCPPSLQKKDIKPGSCRDHTLGNTVILKHKLANGKVVYSQYSHLATLAKDLKKACGSPEDKNLCLGKGIVVQRGQVLGTVGRSGDGQWDFWGAHLHFEIKDFKQLTCSGCKHYGYTEEWPNQKGYEDPIHYLHEVALSGFPTTIKVTTGLNMRIGPGGVAAGSTFDTYRVVTGTPADKQYKVVGWVKENTSNLACSEGWYEIANVGGSYFYDPKEKGHYVPADGGGKNDPHVKYGWVCKGNKGKDGQVTEYVQAVSSHNVAGSNNSGCSSPNQVVNIPDANLKKAIEQQLGISSDPTCAQMQRLKALDAKNAGIKSLEGLQYATNLKILDLENAFVYGNEPNYNQIHDLGPLANLTSLLYLNLSGNSSIRNINPLANLTNLTSLSIDFDNIDFAQPVDLSPISNLTKLTSLALRHDWIDNLSLFSNLTNLRIFDLNDNTISDLNPLANLTNLTSLNLGNNDISDLSPLAHLKNLTILNLGNIFNPTGASSFNEITDLSPLAKLINLTSLDLGSNPISDIGPLANLTSLTKLDLSFNNITNLSPLANLTNLMKLDLGGNQISDLSPLAGLTNLTTLSFVIWADGLGGSGISDIHPLVTNSGLGMGDKVDLTCNPLSASSIADVATLLSRGVDVIYDDDNFNNGVFGSGDGCGG